MSISGSATKLGTNTIRSGDPSTTSTVTFLTSAQFIAGQQLIIMYQYNQEYTCTSGLSANLSATFDVLIGATKLGVTQGSFDDFSAEVCMGGCSTCYSSMTIFTAVIPATVTANLILSISNKARNLNIRISRIELRGSFFFYT